MFEGMGRGRWEGLHSVGLWMPQHLVPWSLCCTVT